MISVSSDFNTAINANVRLWKLKVTITRNSTGATAIDISDRVVNCQITFDWERRNGSASLEIDNYDYSLSPLNRNSATNLVGGVFDPLFDSNHKLEIWYGLLTASGYEWIKRFTGVLGDEIDADSYPGTVSLTARDLSKLMQDTYIYQSKPYGNPPNVVENVMQDMITQFLPTLGVTIQVPVATNFDIGMPSSPYVAKDINLWSACQTLSDASSTDLRFDESGTMYLRVIERELDTVTPVATFYEKNLVKDSMSISDSDVRNHIVLRIQGLDPIEKKDDDSIAKYGRRYMEVTRALANIITSAEQGHQLVEDFLKELSYATARDKMELPLYPMIQIGDIINVNNSKLGTDSAHDVFRVVSINESFSADSKRTELQLQGYNKVNFAATNAPNPITGLSQQLSTRVIQNYTGSGWSGTQKTMYYPLLTWTPPTQDTSGNALAANFGGYMIYRKGPSEAQFYNIASVQSQINLVSQTITVNYFYDYTAKVGSNSYKIVAISSYGKKSADSGIITFTVPASTII